MAGQVFLSGSLIRMLRESPTVVAGANSGGEDVQAQPKNPFSYSLIKGISLSPSLMILMNFVDFEWSTTIDINTAPHCICPIYLVCSMLQRSVDFRLLRM